MSTVALRRRGITASPSETRRPIPATWLAIAALTLVMTFIGASVLVRHYTSPDASLTGTGTLGGITAQLHAAGWLGMDAHQSGSQGGFQMPAQMMPGAPVGDEMRLGVPVTLVNTSAEVLRFNVAEEFSLAGGRNDSPRRPHSDTFGRLSRLTPGNAVDGIIYFDTVVPDPLDASFYLVWNRDGRTLRLAISMLTGMQDHEHSP